MAKKKLVSVIVAAFNEEDVIGRLVDSIKTQSYALVEAIVVDDGSSDKTIKIAKARGTRVFKRKHAERSVQRNYGAKKAKGDYLLFLDADMKLSRNVVLECVEIYEKGKNVGAVVIPESSVTKNFWERVKAFERSFYNLEGDQVTDAARFFSKKVFNKIGGYDETITGPEDWDLPERVKKEGFATKRIKSKIFHYERVPNPIKLAKKKYYYALKSHRYLSKHSISPISAKTIYFLRPVFYKNWQKLLSNPLMALAMIIMLLLEQFGGGLGYIVGKLSKK